MLAGDLGRPATGGAGDGAGAGVLGIGTPGEPGIGMFGRDAAGPATGVTGGVVLFCGFK